VGGTSGLKTCLEIEQPLLYTWRNADPATLISVTEFLGSEPKFAEPTARPTGAVRCTAAKLVSDPNNSVHIKLRDGRECTVDIDSLEIRGRIAAREIREELNWIESSRAFLLDEWRRYNP